MLPNEVIFSVADAQGKFNLNFTLMWTFLCFATCSAKMSLDERQLALSAWWTSTCVMKESFLRLLDDYETPVRTFTTASEQLAVHESCEKS